MNKNIAIIAGAILLIGGAYFVFSGDKEVEENVMMKSEALTEPETEKQGETTMNEGEGAMVKEESVSMEASGAGTTSEEPTRDAGVKAGSYEAYSADKISLASTGDVVLFFHASWCPSCKALNADIEKNAGAIPSGVAILKTDYDMETELKKKYGVTTQHTLVHVDKDGKLIKKWSGGSTLESVLSRIQ